MANQSKRERGEREGDQCERKKTNTEREIERGREREKLYANSELNGIGRNKMVGRGDGIGRREERVRAIIKS